MTTTSGYNDLSGAIAQRSTKIKAVMHRWLVDIRESLRSIDLRQRIGGRRRARPAPVPQLTQVAGACQEPISSDPPNSHADARKPELVPLPDERSQALAVLCDRLLSELDGAEVKAAELRFVVHKREPPGYPQPAPGSQDGDGNGELVWELRRLIASSGGTIADVARALEVRGTELDETARELLKDELEALDVDLATLNGYLADPVDWDSEFERLLSGEVTPFDDVAGDEGDEHDG